MKRIFFAALLAAVLTGCSSKPGIKVTVENTAPFDRTNEMVEVAWSDLVSRNEALTPENVVVVAGDRQVPSQVVYRGEEEPQAVIFQADVAANSAVSYAVTAGVREEYEAKAYGRYVPERMDDYAWENNLVAYRLYGPALAVEMETPGMDVWVKCTDDLIIDKWFKENDYHHNKGEGMDCYKVGTTLGAGACVPVSGGALVLGGNYATQRNLDNGPLRTSVLLTYAPVEVDGKNVAVQRIVSLDADSRFNRVETLFEGGFDKLEFAAGAIMHDVKELVHTDDYVAFTEAASDSRQPEIDGNISLAVVMPSAAGYAEIDGHAVLTGEATSGTPVVSFIGSGWSQGGVASHEDWVKLTERVVAQANNPLKVTVE